MAHGPRDDEAPHARIAAPSTAFWPTLGEVPAHHASAILRALGLVALWPVDLILGKTRVAPRPPAEYLQRVLTAAARLDAIPEIVTWHFYPSLSTRSKLAAHRSTAADRASRALGEATSSQNQVMTYPCYVRI